MAVVGSSKPPPVGDSVVAASAASLWIDGPAGRQFSIPGYCEL